MKKIISVILSLVILLSVLSGQMTFAYDISNKNNVGVAIDKKDIGNSEFLSEEVAEKFVKLFYSQSSTLQSTVKSILTGKKKGTIEEIKGIYNNAVSFFKLLDKNAVEMVVSKGAAVAVGNISSLTNLVSGVMSIYDNGKSFVNSTNAMQKTVDGLQIFSSTMSLIGCSAYIPSSMSIVLSSTEFALALGGYLEKAYFKENATLYQYELEIAYQTDDEIPYRKAPKITIGSGVSQEEADSIFSQLYIEYCVKRMLKTIDKKVTIDDEMYQWPIGVTVDLLDPNVSTDSVRFRYDEFYMFMDESLTNVYAHPFPRNASIGNKISNYTIINSSVITYDSSQRKVTSLNPGIAYIQATTTNGITGACKITVLPYSAKRIKDTNRIILKKYYLNDSEVKIPNKVGDNIVTEIGNDCFKNHKKIKNIVIPDSITTIGDNAFYGCENINNINIPESVEKIGNNAFNDCINIESINIADGVKEIGTGAFSHCENLKNVRLSSKLTNINDYLFYCCFNLENIAIPNKVAKIDEKAFFRCQNLNSVQIGENVSSIGDFSFTRCNKLSKVTMNKKLKTIGESAFADCVNLGEIDLPESLTNIESGAFLGTGLESVIIPKNISTIKSLTFSSMPNLKHVEIPSNVTSVEDRAFSSCSNLTDIKIPNSVNKFGEGVFACCKNLKNVSLPKYISKISNKMFFQCNALEYIEVPSSLKAIGDYAFCECFNLKKVPGLDNLNSIGDNAFEKCKQLTDVTICENVTHIGKEAFSNCIDCKNIDVDSSNKYYSSINGILFDKDNKILKCYPAGKEDDSYSVPNGVIEVESKAFYGCSHLTGTLQFPKSIQYIGEYALCKTQPSKMIIPFVGSRRERDTLNIGDNSKMFIYYFNEFFLPSIKEVEITDETTISSNALLGLYNANTIKLNEGITKLCDNAFSSCGTNMTNIIIPSTVNSIGANVFDELINLKSLYFRGTVECWNNINNIHNNDCLNKIDTYCLGNVNCDSNTNIKDVTIIQKYITNLNELNDGQQYVADIDGDGVISVKDVAKLQKYIVGSIASLN